MAAILLIDDDADLKSFLQDELEARGHVVRSLERAEEGLEVLGGARFDLVLLDNIMPGMAGTEFLEALQERGIDVPVILMTGASTSDTAIRAMRTAFDYVIKPDTFQSLLQELAPLIAKALAITRPAKEVRVSGDGPPQPAPGPMLVGRSRAMVEVYKLIGKFARTDDAVIVRGETGTGKDLVAQAIHTNSPRKNKPYVPLNCTAFNENLLESELFGHEQGAFTGADKLHKGKFEYANGGTLFLDEIGDMPLNLQAKLLRVLEYQEVVRVKGNEPIKVNVRVLSATHRDLEAAIEEGKFRRDLYYRLNRVTLRLPPLRDRLEDLPELAAYFLARAAVGTPRRPPALAESTLQLLRSHPWPGNNPWPGNIRELQNVMYYAFGVCRGPEVLPTDIVFPPGPAPKHETAAEEALAGLRQAVAWAWDIHKGNVLSVLDDLLKRELLAFGLARLNGNQKELGKYIGMARGVVGTRMEEYGLKAK